MQWTEEFSQDKWLNGEGVEYGNSIYVGIGGGMGGMACIIKVYHRD